ncbi:MAG: hypothetical protein ACW99A_19995 [Candidatus Kariarchaeaceae archaeon]
MKLTFIKGNQEAQQFIPLMDYAILHTLEGVNKKGIISRHTIMHTTTSPQGIVIIINY